MVDPLYKHLALAQGIRVDQPGSIRGIDGVEAIERIVAIDQTPIGRTPRSNPATYTKIFDEIRNIFAMTPDARKRGYQPGRFSFNVKGGRCEACSGDGQIRVEMHFLPDVYVTCDVCGGKRYNHETLEVRYRGLNISEVLDMPVREARQFFSNYPVLERRLAVLEDVGLDYIRLGQPATTLSGGEAQRIKISRELGKRSLPGTMYILDEPTTGLHMHEVGKLVTVLHHLVELGATVVVIEHNTDVILASDYVIDLGPGGGENGGRIVAAGTPEAIMADPNSVTGKFLTEERRTRRKLGDGKRRSPFNSMEVLGKGSLSEGKRLPSPSLPTRVPSLAFQRHLCLSACPQRPHQSADCLRGVQGPCSKVAKIGISSPQLQGGILFWGRPPSFSSFLPGSFFDRSEALRRKPEQWAQQRPLRTQKAGSRRETVFFPKRFQRTAYGFS